MMGDHLQAVIAPRYVTSYCDQLSLLPSLGREVSTGGDVLWLRSKGRYDSFQLSKNMWVAGKIV